MGDDVRAATHWASEHSANQCPQTLAGLADAYLAGLRAGRCVTVAEQEHASGLREQAAHAVEQWERHDRLRAIGPDEGESLTVALSRAYLAEHPADDADPVDAAWVDRVAPSGYADVGGGRCGVVVEIRPWALRANGYTIVENPTRGDVRRLLRALRVPGNI